MKKKMTITVVATALIAFSSMAQINTEESDGLLTVAVLMEEGVPGGVVIGAMELEAKVLAIDYEARVVLLQSPSGEEVPVAVGPEAINFDQIKKGDLVVAVVAKELMVYVSETADAADDGAEVEAVAAPANSTPGAIVAGTLRVTGTVMAIDTEAQTATIQFENGMSKMVPVREDIDLSKQKVGEKVVFEITKMVALSVEKK